MNLCLDTRSPGLRFEQMTSEERFLDKLFSDNLSAAGLIWREMIKLNWASSGRAGKKERGPGMELEPVTARLTCSVQSPHTKQENSEIHCFS
jgi:hypothetical protein